MTGILVSFCVGAAIGAYWLYRDYRKALNR